MLYKKDRNRNKNRKKWENTGITFKKFELEQGNFYFHTLYFYIGTNTQSAFYHFILFRKKERLGRNIGSKKDFEL